MTLDAREPSTGVDVLPSLPQVRGVLRKACDANVSLDDLELSYVKVSDKGPVLFLFEGPHVDARMLYVSARRVPPEKGRRLKVELNQRWQCTPDLIQPGTFQQPAFYVPALEMLFQVFPLDQRLPSLPVVSDGRLVAPVLESVLVPLAQEARVRHVDVRPMRYKPQRKCIFRYDITWDRATTAPGVVYGKVARQSIFERTCVILERIHAAARGFAVTLPEPLGVVPELCLEVFSEVPGVPLTDLCGAESFSAHCTRVARNLRQFHELPVKIDLRWDVAAKIERVAEDAAGLTLLFPEEAKRIRALKRELSARLQALAATPLSLIHRDFHGMNVLMAGDHVGFIDLEDCALGDPAEDLGSMYGYLCRLSVERPAEAVPLIRAREAFLNGYPAPIPKESVKTHSALYCFFQALQQLRHPHVADRYRHAEALLTECEQTLIDGLEGSN